jgi:molybdopterin molybdotransferase
VLSVADAMRTVLARVPRLASASVDLVDARGRVLAQDIVAHRALPAFDNSAMDGYAARSAELPATLRIAGVVAAGEPPPAHVPPHAAVRIFTGAPMPADLDAVVMQEDATAEDDHVVLPAAPPGANVRRTGEDIAIGDRVLARGTRLGAWDLGVLAALGVARVPVARAPHVALIATGDELVEVETPPGPGQIVDSSMYALVGLVEEAGGVVERLGVARDEVSSLVELLAAAAVHDVIITTGGVSVGDRDHVRQALAAAGIELELYKVAMKPGKPFSFGLRPAHADHAVTPVFGLPGNPVSSLVAFELFVRPALLAMQGARILERPRVPVVLAGGYAKQPGRAHYVRARVERDGERLIARPHPKQGSAMMSSLIGCNALVELAAGEGDLPPDAPARALLLEAV